MKYDVVIVGGGLAGCAAAILLARNGFTVALREKTRLPQHKLCGEFRSAESKASFERLGVLSDVMSAGAMQVERVVMSTPRGAIFRAELPEAGIGLSRYALDPILMQAAHSAGADCRDGSVVREIEGDFEAGFTVTTSTVTTSTESISARLVLAAYGKRSGLDTALGRVGVRDQSGYVAFKQHFRGELPGVIEMHGFPGGYCGLSPVEDGRVNACFICHSSLIANFGAGWKAIATGPMRSNPRLAARLSSMEALPETLRVIANPSLASKSKFEGDVCMIGDAAGMIAPLCGDGMSMALKSAEIAAALAAEWLAGEIDARLLRRRYTAQWEQEFGRRIAVGRFAHAAGMKPGTADAAVQMCATFPAVGRWLIAVTRG